MKILTISIAAYNMEEYICKALDSLTDERIIDELEIFVVDDGGTDRTLEITKKYAKKYPQSIIPVHKGNGGYGTTVNYSIAHATGKYFKLLDGDDWFDREALYKLITVLRQTNVDVIFTPYKKIYEGNFAAARTRIVSLEGVGNDEEILLDRLKTGLGMWGMTYRTEILKVSGLELPAHTLYTDTIYSVIPLSVCKSVKYLDICVYCYRLGRAGQSVERASKIRHADDEKKIAELLCVFYETELKRKRLNINYILFCTAAKYCCGIKVILLAPICKDTLQRVKNYEKEVGALSPQVYKLAEKQGKTGLFLKLCRRTDYAAYWLLKLIPGGFPDKI